MATKWDIDKWVERKSLSLIKAFYPTLVAKELGLPLHVVFERLLELVEDQRLILKWEVRCEDCLYTIEVLDYFPAIGEEYYCSDICGEYVKIDSDSIFPIFELDPFYKKAIQDSKVENIKKVYALEKH